MLKCSCLLKMKHFIKQMDIGTDKHSKFYDITDEIIKRVAESKISEGHVMIQSLHTTCGLYINEGEERLLEDFILYLNRQAPEGNDFYLHDNIAERDCPDDEPKNGHSHIKAALYSNNAISLILNNEKLQLGQYQRIIFAEFDGPCPRKHKSKRNIIISVLGE